MTTHLLRGQTLSFHRRPMGPDDQHSYTHHHDGAVVMDGGRIVYHGPYDSAPTADRETDHRPHLILPGFIDAHLHMPQVQVIASWGAQLLDWLNTYTFPAEARFADPTHAARMASAFFDQMIAHGTTTPVAFCSVHMASATAYFTESNRRNIRAIGGKVMMDRNAPDGVLDTAQSSYDDSKALIDRWHGTGRALYAITPRFAITSTPAQLEAAGALAAEHPDCHIQTHLSENAAEIELTRQLYPDQRDYLDIYQHYGLVSPRTLLGHCLHLEPREIDALADTGAHPVFCPTSNLFLGSGLFDAGGLAARGITSGIATDIGGGTSYSMLRTLDEGYKALHMRGQTLTPLEGFHWATLGNAQMLGLDSQIGTLDANSEADVIVLDPAATPAMALRYETVTTLNETLFLLQTMGDDRAVRQVYVAGQAAKG